MAPRPCLDCGTPTANGARCPSCTQRLDREKWAAGKGARYDTAWRRYSAQLRRAWVEAHGWVCPGWGGDPAHPSTDLVVDHDVGVLCRQHNAVKAATFDKGL